MTAHEMMLAELRELVWGKRKLWSAKVVYAAARNKLVEVVTANRDRLRAATRSASRAELEAALQPFGIPRRQAQAALAALDQLESRAWLFRFCMDALASEDDALARRAPGGAITRARRRHRARCST